MSPRRLLLVVNVIAILFLSASFLHVQEAFAQTTSLTFNPVADAYVIQSNASTNYGASDILRVDNSPITTSYLRFTVSGLNGATIQSAKLRIYANSDNSSGWTVSTVNNTSWAENSITYSNAPAVGGAIAQSAAVVTGQWSEVDLSSVITSEGTYSLALTTTSSTNTSLASREAGSSKAPQIVITTTTPATSTPVNTATQASTPVPTLTATNPPVPTLTSTNPPVPTLTSTNPPVVTTTSVPTNAPTQGGQQSTLTFKPVADAYVIQSNSSTNYGTNTSLRVDNSPVTTSYVRFTVSGLNGAAVQSAKLRIYANSANSTGWTVSLVNNTSWGETTITYSNAPAIGSVIKQSTAVVAGQWNEVDLSSVIRGEGTYSLALTITSSTNTNLASREAGSSQAPQLIVTTGGSVPATPVNTATNSSSPTATQTAVLPTVTSTPIPTNVPPADWQPTLPIRAAFYYPWFAEAWTQLSIYPYTNYTPTLGYYSSSDLAIINKHIDMMQYGNIQAGIVSWWGQGTSTDGRIAGLLSAATGKNFRWALYYENESQGDPSVAQIQNDLIYVRDHYGSNPSYLRVNGKFVVFVYADGNDACGMADRWKQANTVGAYIVLKVFPGYGSCASQPSSWHQYCPAEAADEQTGYSYTISPGFWLKGQPVRLARDLNRWIQNVKDMVSSNENWQLVTTFSEWGEGTIVEPAQEWASASGYGQYLDALHANGAGAVPTSIPTNAPTNVPTVPSFTPTPVVGGPTNILLLAGDICKHNSGSTDYTPNCKNTGNLVRSVLANNPGAQVQTLGDNVNNDTGSSAFDSQYTDLYAPNWGSFLNVTHTVEGNHDTYAPGGTTPYFNYFGSAAGPNTSGYYSYDIGASWHVIVLNAQCSQAGGCAVNSPQYNWLKNDLAANTRQCILAVWHQPRWTSGRHADDTLSASWWDLLYQYKADIVANGHNHNYERFNLINPQEQAASDGIREFIVGTGGAPADGYSYSSNPLDPNEAIRNQTGVYGVLQLTLGNGYYSWNFLPASGYTFTDSGQTNCH